MLWDESEKTARRCSYVFGGFVVVVGLFLLKAFGTMVFSAKVFVALAGVILLWVLAAGSILAAFFVLAKCIGWCANRFRSKRSGA
jgi:uncharacterized membrane protein (DUF485 family)